jgi:hypothetical protein
MNDILMSIGLEKINDSKKFDDRNMFTHEKQTKASPEE